MARLITKEDTIMKDLRDKATVDMLNDNIEIVKKGRKAIYESKAEKQAAYRNRQLIGEHRISQTYFITEENLNALHEFVKSKKEGQGQFSKYQNESTSDIVNRALSQLLRKR